MKIHPYQLHTSGKIIFLFLLCTLFSLRSSLCQPVTSYAVFSDSLRASGILSGCFKIQNVDTTNAEQFELIMGIAQNDSSVLYQLIDFDNPATLPAGFTYQRNKNQITIGVISGQTAWTYYCSVRIKDLNGNWSNPVCFLTN